MKKLVVVIGLLFAMGLSHCVVAQNVKANMNIDKQPSWGPSGYDYAGAYYFPDIDIYYDVVNTLFHYLSGKEWISSAYLPDKYRKYDLYGLYKVVINDSQPWTQNKTHKKSYSQYKGDRTQESIRYSNDSRYNTSKGNNVKWVDPNQSKNQSKSKNQSQSKNSTNKSSSQKNTTSQPKK